MLLEKAQMQVLYTKGFLIMIMVIIKMQRNILNSVK